MENNHCPSCNREFEMPKRHTIRPDDIEFLCVPRLLECLHTCCQSCLEDSWQKSGAAKTVTCPICTFGKRVDGTSFLPLNGAVLQRILPADGDMPSTCSRCHDDVESFSWCSNCCVALCEFHHQDHKLSCNTKTHDIQTLGELSRKKTKIVHRLPPIPCPHDSSRDSTVFCHVCGCLVSAEAMMLQHRDHEYTDALALVDPSKVLLQESRAVCEDLSERVEEVASRVQAVMADLNSDTNECAQQIENAFAALRKTLVSREKALLSRLKSIADRKKSALSAQLDRLRDLSAECCDLVSCTDALIDAGCRPEDENGGIYMVNTAHYVRQRSHVLKMQYDSMPLAPVADPDILCHLNSNTMESVTVALRTFGWLGTVDNAPSEAKRSERDAKSTGNKEEPLEMEAKAAEAKGEVESSGSFSIPLAITLELKSGLPPMLSKHNKLSTSFESLSVEVRMDCSGKPLPTMKGDIKQEVSDTSYDNNDNPLESSADIDMRSNTNFILTYNPKVRQDQRVSLRPVGSNAQTESGVVGQIFLITEVLFSYMCSFVQLIRININLLCLLNILHEKLDKKLQKTEIRSFFESLNESFAVPTLRITKEVIKGQEGGR